MKKALTIMLAVIMLASMACATASAAIKFQDSFEDSDFKDYWIAAGKNELANVKGNGVLEGWNDARVFSAKYEDDEEYSGCYKDSYSALKTGTFWVDLYTEIDSSDDAWAGLWWKNSAHIRSGEFDEGDIYTLRYYPNTSTVVFHREFPGDATDDEKIILKYEDPRQLGENMHSMTPVTLGMRVEAGKISAFVNGKYLGSFEDATLGNDPCPVLFWNNGLHAYWDNYFFGDLDELQIPGDNPTPNPNPNPDDPTPNPNPTPNPTPTPAETKIETRVETETDAQGNTVTKIVSQVVTVPTADTNTGAQGTGGAQTGDMAVVVVAVMIVALGSAIVVKKVSAK